MAAYRNIYQFSIVSQNGDDVDIFISKKNYAGVVQQRSLGRAPILKRERNGNILGTSLEIYAECKVDGEFSQLYTSSADEFRVEVYRNRVLQWTGFVSPELYSEPDIAPPYDVQIIATDGLGELKNYDFVQGGNPRSFLGHLNAMLAHTSLDLGVEAVSSLEYYDDGWSGNTGMMSVVTDMSHREGEDCYEVLQSILSSVNAVITQQEGKWMVIRESDMHALAGDLGPVAFGAMTGNLWWPVGNLSTDIIPAKKSLALISENHYKATVLDNSQMNGDAAWTKEFNAMYDAEESAYRLPVSGSAIRQKASFYAEVGYRLLLHISARNIGSMEEPQMLGVIIKIDGRMYQAGSEFWLGKRVGYEDKYLWSNTEKSIEVELPASSESDTRSDAQDIDIVIPLYKYNNRSYAYATAVEVSLYNVSGDAAIAVYGCSLSQYDRSAGNKIAVTIGNDAREDAGETDLAFSDGEYALAAADVFRNAIPLGYDSSAIIKKWRTPAAGEGAYLSVMASDYAMQVALPRMRYRGKLNVPSTADPVIPIIFERDSTYYFLNTYSYDLLNDELEVELVSIPNASVIIESETVTELPSVGSASGSSSGSGSSGGGGTSGGGGGPSTLAGLADVQVGNAQNGQALVYENGYWVPRTVSGGGSLSAGAIISALGYTPFDSDVFTKANIKNALGIADWALAANKPSYSWTEIGSRPTALSAFTNDLGLGSLAYKSSLVVSDIPSLPWSKITSGKPRTLSGYGITDAYTQTQADARFLKLAGGTLTGTLYTKQIIAEGQVFLRMTSGDRFFRSRSVDEAGEVIAEIGFGVGSNGEYRGIYDYTDGRWLLVNYGDGRVVYQGDKFLVKTTAVYEPKDGYTTPIRLGGGVRIDGSLYLPNSGQVKIANSAGDKDLIIFQLNNNNDFLVGEKTAAEGYDTYLYGNALHFKINKGATEMLTLTEGGNVGIGTTAPACKLEVNGDLNSRNFVKGGSLASDPTNSFQTAIFGSSDSSFYKMRLMRKDTATDGINTAYSPILAMKTADTHSFLAISYNAKDKCYIGGGSGDAIIWSSILYHNNMDLLPKYDRSYTIGSASLRYKSLAVSDSVQIGDATLTWDATAGMLKIDKGVYSEGAITAKKKA